MSAGAVVPESDLVHVSDVVFVAQQEEVDVAALTHLVVVACEDVRLALLAVLRCNRTSDQQSTVPN